MEEARHESCCYSDGASKLNDAAVADLLEFLCIDVALEPACADREDTACSVRGLSHNIETEFIYRPCITYCNTSTEKCNPQAA